MSPGSPFLSPRRFMALSVGSVLILVALSILLGVRNEFAHRNADLRQAESQAEMLGSGISAALTFDDVPTLRQYARAIMIDRRIEAVAIYGVDRAPLVQLNAPGADPPPNRLEDYRPGLSSRTSVIRPVVERGQRLGAVLVRTRPEPVSAVMARQGSLAVLALVAFVLLAIANWVAGRYATANRRLQEEMYARQQAEAALLQAQKMEAMGQMTGGVAHDFNNLLMVASSGLELLERTNDPARRERIRDSVRQAIDRGASLTQQLLAFSRRAPIRPEVVDLCRRLRTLSTLIERSVSPGVEVSVSCADDIWRVEIDAAQFEVALLNMALNGRDAMGGVGRLDITVGNGVGQQPERVLIKVSDNGSGMSPEVTERIFEPFFTTKGVGKGTGLGLSQVYGFVRSSGGEIAVTSERGQGTTFTLSLPRTHKIAEGDVERAVTPPPPTGKRRRVLLVEDNDDVAQAVADMLQALGYDTRRASTADAALALLSEPDLADAVLSDMVMPGSLDGLGLAREMESRGLKLPIILSTGYSAAAAKVTAEGRRLLMKPYKIDDLAKELSSVLSGP